jgi:hypothetical protein
MNWLQEMLAHLMGAAGRLMAQVFQGFQDRGTLDKLLQLAELYVEKVAGDDTKSGAEKRSAVEALILADLQAEGKVAAASAVNLAIELAVNAAKAKLGTPLDQAA